MAKKKVHLACQSRTDRAKKLGRVGQTIPHNKLDQFMKKDDKAYESQDNGEERVPDNDG